MELRHLKYFVAVAEELHFGRAAARVGIAQPPLSQQIKRLEEEVGARLLHRTKRSVELTPVGKVFLGEARKTLAQAEHALGSARRAARGEVGQLVAGFVSSAIFGRFASVFGVMRSRYPDVALALQDMTSEEQVEAMRANELDVGLVRPPVAQVESIALRVIGSEPLLVALPERHRLSGRREISIAALASEPFLLVPRHLGPGYYDQVIGLCARAGFVPNIVQEARTMQTIVSLVAGGMGISIVPASLQNFRREGIAYRLMKKPVPESDLAVMWRRDTDSPVVRAFLEILWETAGFKSARQRQTTHLPAIAPDKR